MINYQIPKIRTGDLNKFVTFFKEKTSEGPEVSHGDFEELYQCTAEVYESSQKDIEAHSTVLAKNMITIKIRDTATQYLPRSKHLFKIDHPYYPDTYEIISVSPHTREIGFFKIVGEYHGD